MYRLISSDVFRSIRTAFRSRDVTCHVWRPFAAISLGWMFIALPQTAAQHPSNSTLKLPLQSPSNTSGEPTYFTEDAFPGVTFNDPVAVASPPGADHRLFVIERTGRIWVIPDLDHPQPELFLDIATITDSNYDKGGSEGITGIAFHPNYAQNRQFFITYTLQARTRSGAGRHSALARFEADPSNPNRAKADSQVRLLTQYDEGYGHNWNDLAFGPDGYLYVAVGDEGDPDDMYHNSERIDKDFYSGILRIDIDQRPGSLPPNPHPAITGDYRVPPDNPWIGATEFLGAPVDPNRVRTEFYAVGLRNPWRMSFDPVTGVLYTGDVGQHTSEEIDVIRKGGNYGWAYLEGSHKGFRGDPPAGTVFDPPLVEYDHGFGVNQGNCVIGGVVYRGDRLPDLRGDYVFGDYTSGNIWAIQTDGLTTTPRAWLVSEPGMAGFGTDPRNGDLLIIDHDEGRIKRLNAQWPQVNTSLPQKLSETGAFQNLEMLTPEPGIVPYSINVPFWSDNALKRRWFTVPENQSITLRRDQPWTFPSGTIWIKHFDLEMTQGDPSSTRRIETRFLVKTADGVYGATYRWDESGQDATLVPPEGADQTFQIHDQGVVRDQVWHFPGRAECLACHTPSAGYSLGFNTRQLNRDVLIDRQPENQILAFQQSGFLNGPVQPVHTLPALSSLDDSSVSIEQRVRSYLAANCSQCHNPDGTPQANWDARANILLSQAQIIGGSLRENSGDPNQRVVTPGSPERSMLLTRISTLGSGRMPPLASHVLDSQAIDLIRTWITDVLPSEQSFPEWQAAMFSAASDPSADPQADPDSDGAPNELEYLTGRNPHDPSDPWKIHVQTSGSSVAIEFPQTANRGFEVQKTTTPLDPGSWEPLNVPENRPFFSATDRTARILDEAGSKAVFYRVRVFESGGGQ